MPAFIAFKVTISDEELQAFRDDSAPEEVEGLSDLEIFQIMLPFETIKVEQIEILENSKEGE